MKNTEVVNNLHSSPSVPPSVGLREGTEVGYSTDQFEFPASEIQMILERDIVAGPSRTIGMGNGRILCSKLTPANLLAGLPVCHVFVAFALPSLQPGTTKRREIHGAR